MNLIENEEYIEKSKKSKKIMMVIIALIIILVIVCVILLYMINEVQRNTLKFTLDNKSTTFASDLFVIENDKVYVSIKDFATLLGYEAYNGDYKTKYSEDTTNCYITSANEIASFSLNSNTIYKKVAENEDYEYFDLEEPVRLINGKLYVISDGIEIGTNCMLRYNASNNQIDVLSLDYIVQRYMTQFQNATIGEDDDDFNNKKAARYGLIVVQNADGHYGVYDANGQEVIGTKYTSISFKEDSREFTVTTDEGKMGILSSDGTTKIEPNYTDIKQISRELNYYLVNNNNKYGIINQNGNIVIYLEYDKIGIDETRFNTNGIDNPYILFDNCIPVQQNDKWGIFDINGQLILPIEYDEMGCVLGTQSNRNSNNVLIVPQYEAIVVGQGDKYGIISSTGEFYVPVGLDSVYSITSSGEDKYYMTITVQEEVNGKMEDRQRTFDLDEYFAEIILHTDEDIENNTDANTVENGNVVTNAVADGNAVTSDGNVTSTVVNETATDTTTPTVSNTLVDNTVAGATPQ